jgi:hypothetical protein
LETINTKYLKQSKQNDGNRIDKIDFYDLYIKDLIQNYSKFWNICHQLKSLILNAKQKYYEQLGLKNKKKYTDNYNIFKERVNEFYLPRTLLFFTQGKIIYIDDSIEINLNVKLHLNNLFDLQNWFLHNANAKAFNLPEITFTEWQKLNIQEISCYIDSINETSNYIKAQKAKNQS